MLTETPSVSKCWDILDAAAERYEARLAVLLFSGGHDSLVATHVAARWATVRRKQYFVLHIDTGIGILGTQDFVRTACSREGWPLRVYKAKEHVNASGDPDPQIYEDLVAGHGFPGPFMHRKMYNRLKERALERMARDCRQNGLLAYGERFLLVGGCREEESTRRMGNTTAIDNSDGRNRCRVWVQPLMPWKKRHINAYIRTRKLKRNPVVDKLHKSGECLCGAFAKPGEFAELAQHYPEVADRIRRLEREVWERFPWRWDEAPPEWVEQQKNGQQMLWEMEPDAPEPLCTSCNFHADQYDNGSG